jgi:tetratricopeptide (TPR) repeat protein
VFVISIQTRKSWRLLPSLVLVIALAAAAEGQDVVLIDWERLGRQAIEAGNYSEATRYFRLVLEHAETDRVSDTGLVIAFGNLAESLRSSGQYDEADKLFSRAVGILRTSGTVDIEYLPLILSRQGRLYQETEEYSLSESSLKEALHLTERRVGHQHSQMVEALSALGVLYTEMRKWKLAETRFKEAIAIAERLGKEDQALAAALSNLAVLYAHHKQWSRAEPLLHRSLRVAERSFGPEHPETTAILGNLGLLYYWQKRLAEAEQTLRHTLEIRRRLFGSEDHRVAISSFSLALVLAARGDFDEARQRLAEALQVQEQNYGRRTPEVALTLEEFAKLLRKARRDEEAFAMEARAKSIRLELQFTVKVLSNSGR